MEPSQNTTSDLLRLAREGNDQAVGELLSRHREELRQVVNRRLDRAIAQRVDASDIVQDVLLEASKRLADYLAQPTMPFSLWLRHLARDRIIDMHRWHRRAERRTVDREQVNSVRSSDDGSVVDLMGQLRDPSITPAAAALRQEFQARFLDALEKLDEEDRLVIMMRHVDHLSNSEVAEMLGISQPAAGMRHLRALRRLREIIAPPTGQDAGAEI